VSAFNFVFTLVLVSFLFFQNDTSCDELFELFHIILNISLSFSIGCNVSIQMGLQEIQKPSLTKIASLFISWISSRGLNTKTVFAFGILVKRYNFTQLNVQELTIQWALL
jgi:hypothetical protein